MSGDTIIELKNVGVRYRRKAGFMRSSAFWALHDVSFDLRHGETLGVIGRNGRARVPCCASWPASSRPTPAK